MPIFYECQRCTACCRWPGQVRLTDAEITRLAAFKGMGEADFIQQFTRLRWDRGGLAFWTATTVPCRPSSHSSAAIFRTSGISPAFSRPATRSRAKSAKRNTNAASR
jgi:hypothetical protein